MKEILRAKYKALRDELPAGYRKSAAEKIARRLFDLPEWQRSRSVGLYLSARSEVDTRAILNKALAQGKKVSAPKVLSKTRMKFFEMKSGQARGRGPFGIDEPRPSRRPAGNGSLDLILVPGLVFDKKGYRLGYGLGFYDRFLARARKPFLVGLAYGKTLVPSLPHGAKDRPVQAVITEKAIHRAK